jgi:AcrR family transcriptional regulator
MKQGPTSVTRKEQAAASRSALVEAARLCFTESGYAGTTVAAILERAGMARGALYHYFPGGKAEIFTAVFDEINESFHQRRDAVQDRPSPLARLRAGVAVFLDMCTEDDFARIALAEAPQVVPGQGGRGSSYRLLRDQVVAAVAVGELAPLDHEAIAMALYGAVRSAGDFVISADNRDGAVADSIKTLNCFLDALRAVPPL